MQENCCLRFLQPDLECMSCQGPEKLFQALGQPENLQFDPQLFVACDYLEKFSVLSLLFL